jgi:sugar-specific transcriptional regulator TrmB
MNGNERRNGMSLLPEDIFTVFARLGFSNYEAKVYATLSCCGRLKMGLLAKYSTVPQSKIYEVIENLERKGVVIVSRKWPSTAEALPLKEIVSLRVKQYIQDAQTVSKYIVSIQDTEVFKHLYHTRKIALRSNGRLSLPSQE